MIRNVEEGEKMIPESIESVTPAWLSEVLDSKIDAIHVTQIGEGVGLMGDIYRVELVSADNELSSVVVKLPSSFESNREQGVALGMFEAEVRFYKELGPSAETGLPKIYHAEIISGTADFVIVMEDLSDMVMVAQREGMSADQARSAINILGKIHSVWWNQMDQEIYDWIPSMVGPRIEFVTRSLSEMYPSFSENFGSYLSDEGLYLYELFSSNYLNVNKKLAGRSPWTLVHQDCRVENMLFDPDDPERVAVIDWQGIGRGPASYDLAYLLGGSMETDLRREHEERLVADYHEILIGEGILNYSHERLRQDYEISHLQGGLATAMFSAGSLNLNNERGVELISTMVRRHAQAALDHNGIAILEEINKP